MFPSILPVLCASAHYKLQLAERNWVKRYKLAKLTIQKPDQESMCLVNFRGSKDILSTPAIRLDLTGGWAAISYSSLEEYETGVDASEDKDRVP
jgi:hypothetical protein